jgi:UDP-GlcNAc:undecaprenyl-phosphate/decaprenyl-phosphate GlcNAc-1-phosphate transferase
MSALQLPMTALSFQSSVLAVCAASFALTALLTRYAQPLCARLGLIDLPDARKLHKNATPLLGGLALLFAILPLGLLASALVWPISELRSIILMVLAIATITAIGIADDRESLAPRWRVVFGFLVFGGLAALDPSFMVRILRFPLLGFQFGLAFDWFAIFFTALCLVGLVNAVNMADGKNGLVLGLCTGWLLLLALRAKPNDLPMIAAILAGVVALLIMNLRGRLFLGDGGAYGLAAAVGLLTIRTYNSSYMDLTIGFSAEEVVLLFIVPVLDSFRLTFVRWRRGQSPMAPDRDHLHHHLQDRFGWPTGLYVYLFIALVPAAVVLYATA